MGHLKKAGRRQEELRDLQARSCHWEFEVPGYFLLRDCFVKKEEKTGGQEQANDKLHRRRFVKTSTVNHSQRDVDVAPFQIPSTSRKTTCPSKHALMSFRKYYWPVAIGCLVTVSVACHTLILHFSNLNYHDPFLSRTLRRPLSSNVACRVLHRAGNPTFDSNHVHVQVGVSERPFTAPGPSGSVPYIHQVPVLVARLYYSDVCTSYTAKAVALSGQRHIQRHASFRPNQRLLHLRPQFPCIYPPVVPLSLMAVSRRQCNRQAPSPTMGRVENSGTLSAPPSPGLEFNTIRH
ncbi:hypothetical protein CSIM01_04631 [Colletotrichum simmondsii]|uniref:Uncharacterized protein n=1 Tax=Colletotrichum simmondsii TaxID=703756 RepID=A0A135SGT9_9PEZI|nr:hypothetical protein CSIM01_04631 [Colletotrichum simmondsii]